MNKNSAFPPQDTQVTIFGRNVLVTDAMKNYAQEKLLKLDRLHPHIMDIHVTMDIQKLEHLVSIVARFSHYKVKVQSSQVDMYAAIDKATDRLQQKIRRWKDKIQHHHQKKLQAIDISVNVIEKPYDPLEEFNEEMAIKEKKEATAYQFPKVIGNETRLLKTLTIDEAILKMELSDDSFLVFRGEEDRKIRVIYRRKDGNYGVMEVA